MMIYLNNSEQAKEKLDLIKYKTSFFFATFIQKKTHDLRRSIWNNLNHISKMIFSWCINAVTFTFTNKVMNLSGNSIQKEGAKLSSKKTFFVFLFNFCQKNHDGFHKINYFFQKEMRLRNFDANISNMVFFFEKKKIKIRERQNHIMSRIQCNKLQNRLFMGLGMQFLHQIVFLASSWLVLR